MGKIKLYPYKLASASAKEIARALGVKRIIPGGKYRPTPSTTVINWGSSSMHFDNNNVVNKSSAVAKAANKLSAFLTMQLSGVSTVEFTTEARKVAAWLNVGNKAVVRHKLSANSGDGIEILRRGDEVPYAPLYTKYLRKDREFRVHVFKGNVFDFQEKKKKSGYIHEDNANSSLIRSHLNGWIFCRSGVICPEYIQQEAIKAIKSLGLDFGAVDIIDAGGKAFVLEVNTAPGMEHTTLANYVNEFKSLTPTRNRVSLSSRSTPQRKRYVSFW